MKKMQYAQGFLPRGGRAKKNFFPGGFLGAWEQKKNKVFPKEGGILGISFVTLGNPILRLL